MDSPNFMTQNPVVEKIDRLAAFLDACRPSVRVLSAPAGPLGNATSLSVASDEAGVAEAVVLDVRGGNAPDRTLVRAEVTFGSVRNPLLASMPDVIRVPLSDGSPALVETVRALVIEVAGVRCGRGYVVERLLEVVLLLTLRAAVETGTAGPGLLAGLAHPQLQRVLVALHEAPAQAWDTEQLARIAGMSRSRFMQLFPQVVGLTPMAYLTRWRVQFGERELLRGGDRIKAVARRVGFSSAEAFSRAYSREFGRPPNEARLPAGPRGTR